MAIGERIRYIRNLHKITQKWLGVKLGFSEKTAETRVGQYETGVRTPKEDMINEMANIFGVSPQALNLPNIDSYEALLHTLFAIEDIYGLTINTLDDELCLTLDRENSSYFSMYDMLKAWNKVTRKYKAGEITKEGYDNWRYNYPKFDDTQIRAKVPSQELSDALIEQFKDKLKDK